MPDYWKEAQKRAEEDLKRMKRYSEWGEQQRKEAEKIVKERDDEVRKMNEHALGKTLTDEEWEECKKEKKKIIEEKLRKGEK